MDAQDDLTKQIFLITQKIQEEYPELIKYLDEIPRKVQFNAENSVNKTGLKDYLDSLNKLLDTYTKEH